MPASYDHVNEALNWIEESILPSLSLLVESLLEAAHDGPNVLAGAHEAEVRTIAAHIDDLMRLLETARGVHESSAALRSAA